MLKTGQPRFPASAVLLPARRFVRRRAQCPDSGLLQGGERCWRVGFTCENDCSRAVREAPSAARSNKSVVQDNKGPVKFLGALQLCATISRRLYRDSQTAPTVRRNTAKLWKGSGPNRVLTLRAIAGERKRP